MGDRSIKFPRGKRHPSATKTVPGSDAKQVRAKRQTSYLSPSPGQCGVVESSMSRKQGPSSDRTTYRMRVARQIDDVPIYPSSLSSGWWPIRRSGRSSCPSMCPCQSIDESIGILVGGRTRREVSLSNPQWRIVIAIFSASSSSSSSSSPLADLIFCSHFMRFLPLLCL